MLTLCCRGGYIAGNCSTGFYCLAGSSDYTPEGEAPPSDPIKTPCPPDTVCAGPCPGGHYCPEAVKVPLPCPEHRLRNSTGAGQLSECVPCPAGHWCYEGKSSYQYFCTGRSNLQSGYIPYYQSINSLDSLWQRALNLTSLCPAHLGQALSGLLLTYQTFCPEDYLKT